jgi:chemotaxis protein methyltransferase CheR
LQMTVEMNTKPGNQPSTITSENYAFLQNRVYRDSGIVLDNTKQYLMEARLMPIVRDKKMAGLDELCASLRRAQDPALSRQVVEAMTTNETMFFRDVPMFDRLRENLLPALAEKRMASRTLYLWSAAASTGQEAYSLAILLAEMGLVGWKLKILGTDLNTQVLDRARKGSYLQLEANRGLPAKYLTKYFERVGLQWKVKDELRAMVEFKTFDLRQSMKGMGPFDLVLCRNVLIYFDAKTKKQILNEVRSAMTPGATLILGSAETALGLEDRYGRRALGSAVTYEAI